MGYKSNRIKYKDIAMVTASAMLSFLLYVSAFSINGVGLFSEMSFIISDVQTQYIPFLSALKNGDVFFNQNIGLSMNFFPTFAYYLASPFNLVVLFFDTQNLDKAALLIFWLKISCSAATMSLYLKSRVFSGYIKPIIFSVAYSLMSFGLFFYSNFFWFDAVVLLPLIVLAVEQIFDGKDARLLLIFSVSSVIITNFYMAYITGLFVALYTVYLAVLKGKVTKKILCNLFSCVAVSALLSAFIVFPNVVFMAQNSVPVYNGYGEFNFTLKQLLLKLFIGFYDGAGNQAAPTVYCSLLVFSLVALYFVSKKFSVKEKIATMVFVGFMFISFLLPELDIVWHGFSYPNSFPYRYAFCFCFLLISVAAKSLNALDSVKKRYFVVLTLAFLSLYIFIVFFNQDIEIYKIVLTSMFGVIYCITLFLINKKYKIKAVYVGLLLFLTLEMFLNAKFIINTQVENGHFPNKQIYTTVQNDKQQLLTSAGYFDTQDKIYRVGETDISAINDGSVVGYYGFSFFTSTYDVPFQQLMGEFGYDDNFKAVAYRPTSLISDSVLGVKYAFSNDVIPYLREIDSNETTTLYENIYALPLGFEADKAVISATASFDVAEQNQMALLTALVGDEVFEIEAELIKLSQNTLKITQTSNNGINGTINMSGDNVLFLSMPYSKGLRCKVDGAAAEIVPAFGALCAIPLEKGEHEIEIYFVPNGFEIGIVVSAVTAVGVVYFGLMKRNRRKH